MHDTTEVARWRQVSELSEVADLVRRAAYRAEEMEALAEKAVRDENRREVREWARSVLDDPQTVVVALATTGLHDPTDVVEAVALAASGGTVFSERVRPAAFGGGDPIGIEEEAARMHGHTGRSLRDAPTFSEVWPRLREALEGKRVVAYNAQYIAGVLEQTVRRYRLEEPAEFPVECAMLRFCRVEGDWDFGSETYSYMPLPDRDGTPRGNAKALLDLVRELAARGRPNVLF